MKTKSVITSMILLLVMEFATAQVISPDNFAYNTQIAMVMNPFKPRKDLVGSKFLFSDWVGGKVINNRGEEFSGGARFNLDKLTQNLYIQLPDTTKDVAFLVDRWQLKAIYLTDGNQSYNFEKTASLDTNFFYRVLLKSDKYSLYSRIKTTFIPSDFHSNGIISSGNLYDEYKDEMIYYIIFPDNSAHEITFKKKTIKSVLKSEEEKVNKFLENSSGEINETIVARLLETLNE